MNKIKLNIIIILLLLLTFIFLGKSVLAAELLPCKYKDEKGNLDLSITIMSGDVLGLPDIDKFWDKKDVTVYYDTNKKEVLKDCPKYALAVVKNVSGYVYYSNLKEELEKKVNENEDWTYENPKNVEKNLFGVPKKSSAVIGFLIAKGNALSPGSKRVCSYEESVLGCEDCAIDLTFIVPKIMGVDHKYNINVLSSYEIKRGITNVVIDNEQWKVEVKYEGQGDFSYISPVANLDSFCPDNLSFKYDPSQGTLYIFPNEESAKNINAEDEKNTTLRHEYVGANFCSDIEVQKVLRLAGYLLIIVKVVVPLILIVLGTLDLYKAVVGKDEKDLTKSIKTLSFRLILGIFIFFIPTIVNYMFDLLYESSGDNNNKQCVECLLEPNSCNIDNN